MEKYDLSGLISDMVNIIGVDEANNKLSKMLVKISCDQPPYSTLCELIDQVLVDCEEEYEKE